MKVTALNELIFGSLSGPFRPCLHLLGSWMIRGGVWLIAAISLVSNGLVVLSVFFSPASVVTPPKLLVGLLALVNGLMGVWSGWLAAVDAWTFGSFWRFEYSYYLTNFLLLGFNVCSVAGSG